MKSSTTGLSAALTITMAAVFSAGASATTADQKIVALLASTTQVERAKPLMSDINLPYYRIRNTDVGGFINARLLDDGFLSNGQEVYILPLVSGGSGGIFYGLIWTKIAGHLRFVGYVPSPNGHLDIGLNEGEIRVITPIYRQGDPSCCPSSHDYERYTLRGIGLVRSLR